MVIKSDISTEEDLATKILDYRIDPVRDNILGQVSRGMIRLSGLIVELYFPSGLKGTYMPARAQLGDLLTNTIFTCTFDIPEEECWSKKPVLFLGMTTRRGYKAGIADTNLGLLISPAGDNSSSFSRIRLATITDSQVFSKFLSKDLILI